jgi:hypothetical protein
MARKGHGWAVTPAFGVLLWIATWVVPGATASAQAPGIGGEKPGAFQACLDGRAKAWIDAKVELVVNEDPDMGAINDASVAQWAAQAIKECGAKGAGADAASELQFMKYMSRWRDHIYMAANEIRRRSRPD